MTHWTNQLDTFTDTTDLSHATESVLITKGVSFVIKHADAKWLKHSIAGCLLMFDDVDFITVTLNTNVTDATLTLRDENGNVLIQKNELARFDLAEMSFPCINMDENWLIMLPSEYNALRAECSVTE